MNKQFLIILMVCMVGWLAVLTFMTVNPSKAELPAELERGDAATVAYVHGDSIQRNYRFIEAREQAMFAAVQQSQLAVERMARPLQEEAQELIEYASGAGVAEDEVQMAQNRLYEIEAQLSQIQNEAQSRLVQMENALQAEVSEKLTDEVAIFAKENGIEVVLNWGLSGEGVLYGAPGFDVTEALLEFLNERHEGKEEEPDTSAEETE
jgi:Skp family chaperone for outer membrane proteins